MDIFSFLPRHFHRRSFLDQMAPSSGNDASAAPTSSSKSSNKQQMGLFDAINLLLACIIGSGIFISAKSVLEFSGSYGLSIGVWIGCGIICIMVNSINFLSSFLHCYSSSRSSRVHFATLNLAAHTYLPVVITRIFVLPMVISLVFFVFGLKLHYHVQ